MRVSTYARYRALAEEAGKLFEGASQTGWGGPAICPGQFPALVWLKYVFDVRSPPICPFDGYEMAVIEDLELQSEIAIRHLLAQIPATLPPSGKGGKKRPAKKRPAHRPSDTDHMRDAAIGDKWLTKRVSGSRISIAEFARLHGIDEVETRYALGRDKKRRRTIWAAQPPAGKKSVKRM